MTKSFYVRAVRDPETQRYYSESDIIGLHIETETLDEFEEVMKDVAAELVIANHYSEEELASAALKDIVPTILWERPRDRAA